MGVIATAVGALLAAGFAAAIFLRGLVKQDDLRREHDATAAALADVQTDARALAVRVTRTEVDLDWIKGALYQIAQRTGATAVPPPPK